MAEQNETGAFSSGEAPTSPSAAPPPQVVRYRVVSMVRRVQTRTQRATSPGRHRFKQYLFQGTDSATRRLVRSRPIDISSADLEKNLEELRTKWRAGIIEVRTMDGRTLNLDDFSVGPERLAAPLPHPPLDSVNNDTPTGYSIPHYAGGVGQNDPAADRSAAALAEQKAKEAESATGVERPVTEGGDLGSFEDPALGRESEESNGGENEQTSVDGQGGEGAEDQGSGESGAEGQSSSEQVTQPAGKHKKKGR